VPYFLFIEEVLRVKTLSYLAQLVLGKFPWDRDSAFMHTADSSVGTEVTGRLIKSPRLSGIISTSTGRLFRVERSVYGKGMLTIPPGLTFIPYPVFCVVPDMIHNRNPGFFQILYLFVPESMFLFNVFYKIKDFFCYMLRQPSGFLVNFVCYIYNDPSSFLMHPLLNIFQNGNQGNKVKGSKVYGSRLEVLSVKADSLVK
jgi:hypothetical protein